jgi:hypothetical protein
MRRWRSGKSSRICGVDERVDLDEQKLRDNIDRSDNDDLLDRVTAYRAGMEPAAIEWIERELHRRGVTAAQIQEYAETCQRDCVFDQNGSAKMCSFCRRPAVREGWGWHALLGMITIIPCWLRYCKDHDPAKKPTSSASHPHPPA